MKRGCLFFITILIIAFGSISSSNDTYKRYYSDENTYKLYQYLKQDGSAYWVLVISGSTYEYHNLSSVNVGIDHTVYMLFNNGTKTILPPYQVYDSHVYVVAPPCPMFKNI